MKYVVFLHKLILLNDLKLESGLETTRSESQKKTQTWTAMVIIIKTLIVLKPVREGNDL